MTPGFWGTTASRLLEKPTILYVSPKEGYQEVGPLLSSILDRSKRTLSTISSESNTAHTKGEIQDHGNISAREAAMSILDAVVTTTSSETSDTSSGDPRELPEEQGDIGSLPVMATAVPEHNAPPPLNYRHNPTITSTALAQELWKHVLRPGVDTAIDATAGNGGDSLVLAKLLFPSLVGDEESSTTASQTQKQLHIHNNARLICVDIQQAACEKTRQRLAAVLPPHVLRKQVQIIHGSHAPLPLLDDDSSVALVVYNLGFLPRSDKSCTTTTETTIRSLVDATRIVRVGGLLSILTYPRTNAAEGEAVRAFCEGLALFSSRSVDWREQNHGSPVVQEALEEVWEQNHQQKWRVHETKKLGWEGAPTLLTATRIE